ncbi:RED-like protein N-terminal region-domain-containing protein [Cokeromyces recurvatus]|uniref:RED-like protein N-terminal region-domain-containing protein n=1 Tax=Cokeromyces recurvatus TaxID=90255 RepID=UPI00222063BE|nr:RED-like protein N-terminal region-domain-containing protein [Cokeromyces recurvatus]KAI7901911.1 RED-like protein N-terminal region-domain-containing protein [Cokeromyces recurvatus]
MPAPRTPRNTGAIFAQPRSIRKKNFKKGFKKDGDDDDDQEQQQEKINYRDRAAERRRQEMSGVDDSQLTTEELLKRTQAEVDEELDAKTLYEQSKYLGGDVDHTHLVKGLDYALLRKVKNDLLKQQQQQQQKKDEESGEQEEDNDDEAMDEELDQVFERIERGEEFRDDSVSSSKDTAPKFHTLMAKNIYLQIEQQINPDKQDRVELFEPGKMAFVFELADEVGHYSDAFAIPTAVIRSKSDIAARLAKSGWSEESQAESSLVIEKISQVMARLRNKNEDISADQEKKRNESTVTSEPVAMVEDGFIGDIFADVGRDYELNEGNLPRSSTEGKKEGSYFQGLINEKEEDEDMVDVNESDKAVNALLKRATSSRIDTTTVEEAAAAAADSLLMTDGNSPKRRKQSSNINMELDTDADAADIDMFGLSSSALPTSFEEHHAISYQSNDNDDSIKLKANTQMIDQGTNRNKKAQLTRWDFDTQEEWQKYKDSIEIHPKSAFQFGVKLGDGRKRHRERKELNDKQRLNREYQQVKNIISQKYGKSLDK